MTQEWGIRYGTHGEGFVMSISGPLHGGWHNVLVECDETHMSEEIKETVQEIVEENGFHRPHGNWDWTRINTTYMRKSTTYHEIRVRRNPNAEPREEE